MHTTYIYRLTEQIWKLIFSAGTFVNLAFIQLWFCSMDLHRKKIVYGNSFCQKRTSKLANFQNMMEYPFHRKGFCTHLGTLNSLHLLVGKQTLTNKCSKAHGWRFKIFASCHCSVTNRQEAWRFWQSPVVVCMPPWLWFV